MSFVKPTLFMCAFLFFVGCKDLTSDLNPSGKDQRAVESAVVTDSIPGLTVQDVKGTEVNLSEAAPLSQGLVLYFTMWCPICSSHTDHLVRIMPNHPKARLLLVDYVSATLDQAAQAQQSSGYGSLEVLVDNQAQLTQAFSATMSTVVVINSAGKVVMQEDFKNGARLEEVLNSL